jgi:hypothetical protein
LNHSYDFDTKSHRQCFDNEGTIGLTQTGKALAWGKNEDGQCGFDFSSGGNSSGGNVSGDTSSGAEGGNGNFNNNFNNNFGNNFGDGNFPGVDDFEGNFSGGNLNNNQQYNQQFGGGNNNNNNQQFAQPAPQGSPLLGHSNQLAPRLVDDVPSGTPKRPLTTEMIRN